MATFDPQTLQQALDAIRRGRLSSGLDGPISRPYPPKSGPPKRPLGYQRNNRVKRAPASLYGVTRKPVRPSVTGGTPAPYDGPRY